MRYTYTYSNAGHPYPLLYRARTKDFGRLRNGGLILGILPDERYEEDSVKLEPGDVLVLYTDGITEAENGIELFGEERLRHVVAEQAHRPAEDIQEALFQFVLAFSGQTQAMDDRTVIVMKREE
jgi:sigma-B regulation protein RsbU (phosphoserine phosphatase)